MLGAPVRLRLLAGPKVVRRRARSSLLLQKPHEALAPVLPTRVARVAAVGLVAFEEMLVKAALGSNGRAPFAASGDRALVHAHVHALRLEEVGAKLMRGGLAVEVGGEAGEGARLVCVAKTSRTRPGRQTAGAPNSDGRVGEGEMGAADLRHPLRAEGRGHALVEVVATTSIGIVVLGANRANVVGRRPLRPGRPGRRRGVDVDRRRRVASRARLGSWS